MKRLFFIIILALASSSVFAQAKIDTLYYDKNGYGIEHKEFADYYRIVLYSADSASAHRYRDFHINGQVMSSGEFISIDKNDDRNSKFIGSVIVYDNKGDLSAIRNYQNGLLNGISEEFLNDGLTIQEEFKDGKPAKDHYVKFDKQGNMVKIRYADNSIIWESPMPSEISEDMHDEALWRHYSKNGVTIALYATKINDYGKYHSLNLTISNNSLVPLSFEPSKNITVSSVNHKNGEETMLKVYSCEEYLKKFDRRNSLTSALMGVSDLITMIDGGVSEEKTVTVNDKGEKSVSYTKKYDPFDHRVEVELDRIEARDFEQTIKEGREVRQLGYFKTSIINPGETVSGYVYVQREKGDEVTAYIDIEGAIFPFTWSF